VEAVKEDDGENKKGDIIIHLPAKTAERLHEYLAVNGLERAREICKSTRQRRRNLSSLSRRVPEAPDGECSEAVELLSRVVLDAATEGNLQQLVPTNANNPMDPATNAEGGATPDILVAGHLVTVGLVRQMNRNGVPGRNVITPYMATASTIVRIVMQYVLEETENWAWGEIIRMEEERLERVKTEDCECEPELVCLEDNCKGYFEFAIGSLFSIGGNTVWQTGKCTAVRILKYCNSFEESKC
jgi:hypothetical protein